MAAKVPNYEDYETEFLKSFDNALGSIEKNMGLLSVKEETFNGNTLTLKNNTVHVYNGNDGISSLSISYPSGSFISTVLFSTAKSGKISVTFPSDTKFVGSSSYEFFPAENWELNIHNGRVVGAQLY